MEPRHKVVVLSKCPECENKIVVWDIQDPYFSPNEYTEKIFKQIRQKVKELAKSLQEKHTHLSFENLLIKPQIR